jgi:hypothetical protein
MLPRRHDRCGARLRRDRPSQQDSEPHVPETQELGLTALGAALIEALRDDERFRDAIADPFGDDEGDGAAGP